MTRFISITSGKRGVGKTRIATHLAMELAQRGERVCLIDADWGLANVNVVLKLQPQHTLEDMIVSGLPLDKVLLRDVQGVDIIPGSSGSKQMLSLTADQPDRLATAMQGLDCYDFVLIDSPPDSAPSVLALSLASPEVLMVITTEPTSMTDAYGLLKSMHAARYRGQAQIIVNNSRNHTIGRHTYDKFREVVDFYLQIKLPLLGLVQEKSLDPDAPGVRDIASLADQLLRDDAAETLSSDDFGQRYLAAARVDSGSVTGASDVSKAAVPQRREPPAGLEQQIDLLTGQVDALITEVARLRQRENSAFDESVVPLDRGRRRLRSCCPERWVAELASDYEVVSAAGSSFPIYQLEQSDGKSIRFACHSVDDAHVTQEPQSTSS